MSNNEIKLKTLKVIKKKKEEFKEKDLKNKINTNNTTNIIVTDNQEEKKSLAERLINLKTTWLSEVMKVIFAKIQIECSDFRENVFFKNLNIIESETAKQNDNQTRA